eukprot:10703781-Lingulodinium_polyedra.AAC.1
MCCWGGGCSGACLVLAWCCLGAGFALLGRCLGAARNAANWNPKHDAAPPLRPPEQRKTRKETR